VLRISTGPLAMFDYPVDTVVPHITRTADSGVITPLSDRSIAGTSKHRSVKMQAFTALASLIFNGPIMSVDY